MENGKEGFAAAEQKKKEAVSNIAHNALLNMGQSAGQQLLQKQSGGGAPVSAVGVAVEQQHPRRDGVTGVGEQQPAAPVFKFAANLGRSTSAHAQQQAAGAAPQQRGIPPLQQQPNPGAVVDRRGQPGLGPDGGLLHGYLGGAGATMVGMVDGGNFSAAAAGAAAAAAAAAAAGETEEGKKEEDDEEDLAAYNDMLLGL